MTPDMKRLCEAANVPLAALFAGEDVDTEAIVCAVLIAQKDLYLGTTTITDSKGTTVTLDQQTTRNFLSTWLDHILAEPATA